MILTISGMVLILFGLLISIVFWIPGILDRGKMREVLGKHYRLVYVVYIANGPMLLFFGILLIIWSKTH